jgi:ankyrin repeat protein
MTDKAVIRAHFVNAVERGNSKQAETAISTRSFDVNQLFNGQMPLLLAVKHGRTKIAEMLLKAGARIDAADSVGWTACHVAAIHGEAKLMTLLLAHKADIAAVDDLMRTPLNLAIKFHNESVVPILLDAGARLDDNVCWAASSSTSVIQVLLNRGVVLRDLRDDSNALAQGSTPLHWAVSSKDIYMPALKVLVSSGVDLNARDSFGNTCCHTFLDRFVYAERKNLIWLIDSGVDLEVVNSVGHTPLHRACMQANGSAIFLVAAGADVHKLTGNGDTACHLALARVEQSEAVELIYVLHAVGASIDVPNQTGDTVRQLLAERKVTIRPRKLESTLRAMVRLRLDFVRKRALQICIALQSLRLDALQMCEILVHACGAVAPVIRFHHWWNIVTAVKHYMPQPKVTLPAKQQKSKAPTKSKKTSTTNKKKR